MIALFIWTLSDVVGLGLAVLFIALVAFVKTFEWIDAWWNAPRKK